MPNRTASFPTSWRFPYKPLLIVFALILAIQTFLVVRTTRWHGDPKIRAVALTFDDGPNPPSTDTVLEVLARNHVRATFFLLGRNIEMHRATAQAIRDAGHEIGNHSYSHRSFSFVSWETIHDEIDRTDRLIHSLRHEGAPCVRAPYGVFLGLLPLYLWYHQRRHCGFSAQSTPPDYLRPDPREVATSLANQAEPGTVFLLHDGEGNRAETVIALEMLIRALKNRNFEFRTASEILW